MPHTHPFIAKLLVASLIVVTPGPAPAAQTAAAQATRPVAPADGGWPRAYTTATNARVVLYQPQIGQWPEQKHMTMFAAVSYQGQGDAKPALGTLKIEADTKVALDERLVRFENFRITEANFQTIDRSRLTTIVEELNAAIPDEERVIGLDRVMAAVDTSAVTPHNVPGIKNDPPPIAYSDKPAVLVNFDGDPVWSPVTNSELKFAVNTNWDVLESPEKRFFLRVGDSWLTADAIRGPWTAVTTLPQVFTTLPANDNWKEARAAVPGKPFPAGGRPVVFISMVPAELIRTTGAPAYRPVPGTTLQWVSNTESDVFRQGTTGPIYYLAAGRWFSAPSFKGPWQFATPTLPADFKKIPVTHPRSRVLASVPGTRQAVEAVLLAQIPQTARVNRKELQAPTVEFAGEPQFQQIQNTTVARAVNTDKDIILVGNEYYLCYEGVWFKGSSPTGPWEVATSVPQAIYAIPVSSPAHNVTYVTIEDDDDFNDDWVEFAAAAGYTGLLVDWGAPMWGTGWYYPPYVAGGAYWGHYPTYGYGAAYNPWTGAYTRGGAVYGPYGGAGYGARYNPRTGTYTRGAAAYGPYGARGVASAWNPRTGTSAFTRQGSNVYGSWGSTAVQRGDAWANTARVTNRATGTTTRATQGSGGGDAITRNRAGAGGVSGVARTGSGDVYAGRDGNVYRNDGGSWQKYDNGSWNSVDRSSRATGTSGRPSSSGVESFSSAISGDLNRDWSARSEGARRSSDLGSYRSGGNAMRMGSGSFRSSGGGFGGGGFRGGGRR